MKFVGTLPLKVVDSLFNHPFANKGLDQFLTAGR
jgi:hypothetical protein